jgi:glycosyltransferase involved in cell wall biosynthesis
MIEPEARVSPWQLSVIVPTRNRAGLLRRALKSIMTQISKDVEVIVVDDGSDDDTQRAVSEFASATYHRMQGTSGASAARNRGAALAHGQWLLFLDDDDELKLNALAVILTHLRVQHDVCMFYVEQVMPNGVCRVPRNQLLHEHTDKDHLMSFALRPISASQVVVRREVFHRLGGFDENLRTCNDIDLWARLLLAGAKVGVIQEILATKHEHSEGQLTRNLPVFFEGHREFLKKWRSHMRRRLSRTDYHRWYARRLEVIFQHHCGANRRLATPLPLSASLRYGAQWLKLAAVSPSSVRAPALRRALVCGLRAVLSGRAYSAIATRSWMQRHTEFLRF